MLKKLIAISFSLVILVCLLCGCDAGKITEEPAVLQTVLPVNNTPQERVDNNWLTDPTFTEIYIVDNTLYERESEGSVVYSLTPDGNITESKYTDKTLEKRRELEKHADSVLKIAENNVVEHDGKTYVWNYKYAYVYENNEFKQFADTETLGDMFHIESGYSFLSEPYYYYQLNQNGKKYLCRYDMDNMTVTDKINLRNIDPNDGEALDIIFNLVADGDYAYYYDGIIDDSNDASDISEYFSAIYRVDFKSKKNELLYDCKDTDEGLCFQLYKGDLYFLKTLYGDDGLKSTELYKMDPQNPKELTKLYEGDIEGFQILDDGYIYLIGYKNYGEYKILSRLDLSDNSVTELLKPGGQVSIFTID